MRTKKYQLAYLVALFAIQSNVVRGADGGGLCGDQSIRTALYAASIGLKVSVNRLLGDQRAEGL